VCTSTSEHMLGFNYAKGGKRYEYLYVGCGVFISSRNIFKWKTLQFGDKVYSFEYFVPEEPSLDGIFNIYYVDALKDVAAPWPLYKSLRESPVLTTFSYGGKKQLKPTKCVGRDDGVAGSMSASEAERLYGISKFKIPPFKEFGSKHFLNEVVSVQISGQEYPAIASYHANHDPKRSPSVGSVRLFSSRSFKKRVFVRA